MKIYFQKKKIQKKNSTVLKQTVKTNILPHKNQSQHSAPVEEKKRQSPHEFLNQKISELLKEKVSYFNLQEIENLFKSQDF